MSDLDESGLDGGGGGDLHSDDEQQLADHAARMHMRDPQHADADYDASTADADSYDEGEHSPERGGGGGGAASFSDSEAYEGGAGGDASRFDADEYDEHGEAGEGEYADGDPSSIHAPAGASAAASEAAARLARLMAADQQDEGSGAEVDDDERMARREEIEALEAQLQRTSNSSRSSKGAAAMREEKEQSSSQRHSQRASHRSGGGGGGGAPHQSHGDDLLDDDLGSLGDEFDDDDEYNGQSDGESDYDGHGHGHGGGHGGGHGDGMDSDDEVRTAEDVARAKEEREHLIEVNKIRQKQIAMILEREKQSHHHHGKSGTGGGSRGAGAGLSSLDDKHGVGVDGSGMHPEQIRVEYMKNLENLNLLWDELESKREEAEEKIDRLTSKLDAADERAAELSDSFKSFKREISKEARFSRTGKPIKLKRILAFEAAEEAAERDVARVRLRHINLLNELRVLEDAVRTKEKLAEGLHLIDFEQLKIENQTLNEKIEERNDELHKLKKKTTTTVQVLTHIKEKLQCVREENAISAREVDKLNAAVGALRDQLTRTKHARDESRFENQLLKQKQGFIGSDLLVSDFENRKADIDVLRGEVEGLKARWRALNNLSVKAASIERTHARMDNEQALQRQTHYATVKFGGAQAGGAGAGTATMGANNSVRR